MKTTQFLSVTAHKAPPTKKHVPAIWEGLLGTVYAQSPDGVVRYFDYNYEAARAWAGLSTAAAPSVDIRCGRSPSRWGSEGPRRGQIALWVRWPVQEGPDRGRMGT